MGSPMNQNEGSESPTVLLRRLHHWRMAFFGMVILLAGMLSGAAVTLLIVGHPGPKDPAWSVDGVRLLLERLTGPLHLTADQRQQMEPIVKSHLTRLDQIQGEGRKAVTEELRRMTQEAAGVLTEDQMRLWERLFLDLPGSMRHIPQELGPGYGRGPAPRGGWHGPPAGRGGPPHVSVPPTTPDANTVPHN